MSITRVSVGPFLVDDLSYESVVNRAADLADSAESAPTRAYALHVGGLNAKSNLKFVEEMRTAELVYADGASIVILGRLAGAEALERAATTDVGWDILKEIGRRQGRPARVALIGGPPGLAGRAAETLHDGAAAEVVFTCDGYQADWEPVVEELHVLRPDVCVVGLGAPREMLWVRTWLDRFPPALILTSGGWFGFLAGEEKRAPSLLRRAGLEWLARLAQSPTRLAARYAQGLLTSLSVAWRIIQDRRR